MLRQLIGEYRALALTSYRTLISTSPSACTARLESGLFLYSFNAQTPHSGLL
jgi:hypothetical protein